MIIADLDYLEIDSNSDDIAGSLYRTGDIYTSGSVNALANSSVAYASATAIAIGDNTLTFTKTDTNIYKNSFVAISQASAVSIASARTANSYSYYQAVQTALFVAIG
jgi:hypothetical protein